MSSFVRRMGRRIAKRSMTATEIATHKETKTQSYVQHEDGSYSVLHPTRGWRSVSARRMEAQRRMAQLLGA